MHGGKRRSTCVYFVLFNDAGVMYGNVTCCAVTFALLLTLV